MQRNTLPPEWVERIFMRLHGRFGNPFLAKYRVGQIDQATGEDIGLLNAKRVWGEELSHLSQARISKAIVAKYDSMNGPSADDFVRAATPVPACHRDNEFLALPKPKMDPDKVQGHLQRMRAVFEKKEKAA